MFIIKNIKKNSDCRTNICNNGKCSLTFDNEDKKKIDKNWDKIFKEKNMYKVLDVVGIAALLAVGFIAAHFAIGVVIGLAMF